MAIPLLVVSCYALLSAAVAVAPLATSKANCLYCTSAAVRQRCESTFLRRVLAQLFEPIGALALRAEHHVKLRDQFVLLLPQVRETLRKHLLGY